MRSPAVVRLALVSVVLLAAHGAPAANEYRCGEGGKPNKTSKTCDCPPGKVEQTVGDVSKCVPAPKPPPATSKPTAVPPPPPLPPAPTSTPPASIPPPASTPDSPKPAPIPTLAVPAPTIPAGTCPSAMAQIPGGPNPFFKEKHDGKDPSLAAYCLDLTEVTVQAYAGCVAAGKCAEPFYYKGAGWPEHYKACNWKHPAGRNTHPVNCVQQPQAVAYCQFVGKRLPSGPEWLWAAKGGDKNWQYAWGNEEPTPARVNACGSECASYSKGSGNVFSESDGYPETAPVGSFAATRWGLHDMAGNVKEWTTTLGRPAIGGDDEEARRVAGGASYASRLKQEFWLSAGPMGGGTNLTQPSPTIGFRCARTL